MSNCKRWLFWILPVAVLGVGVLMTGSMADSSADYQKAMTLFEKGRYQGAIRLLEGISSADSSCAAKAHHLLGLCQYRHGKLDYAIAAFEQGLRLVRLPEDTEVLGDLRWHLFRAYLDAKLLDKAEALMQERSSQDPAGSLLLGIYDHAVRGDCGWVSSALTELLTRFPARAKDVPFHEIIVMIEQGDPASVAACIDALYSLAKADPYSMERMEQRLNLAVLLWQAGRTDRAIEWLNLTASTSGVTEEKIQDLLLAGSICMSAKRYAEAAAFYEQVCSVSDASAECRARAAYSAGYCHLKAGSADAGLNLLREVQRSYPDSAAAKEAAHALEAWLPVQEG